MSVPPNRWIHVRHVSCTVMSNRMIFVVDVLEQLTSLHPRYLIEKHEGTWYRRTETRIHLIQMR